MAPILYLTGFLFSLALACFAEIISLRSAPGRTQALVERLKSPAEFTTFHSSSPDATSDNELDLLDVVLVASVDGKFHALSRTSGHPLWSMSSFPSSTSISAPSTLAPLIRTNHIDHDPDLTDETTLQELYIIEPQSGDIYVMATPTSPLQRFPFSMSELVDMSPFSFSGSDDRRVFVGRKETSLLLIELETGKIKATLNSECAWDQRDDEERGEVDLDELEGSSQPMSTPTEVYIGRTDYHISIHTRPLSRESPTPRVPVQNLSFSTYGPNNKDNHLQGTYRRTKDDLYIQSLPNGEIISFKARFPGESVAKGEPQVLWGHTFKTPIVAVFDVLRKQPHTRHNAIALLQPRPQLQDVLPNLTPDTATAHLPNLEAVYVGMVKETGSLFAMSPTRFPLVAFGGSERYIKGRLIDAPVSDATDLPPEVDAITRARKYKEMMESWDSYSCEGSTMYTDRRCLVGVRPLEDGDGRESRLKRLLDGPTDQRFPVIRPVNGGAQNVEVMPAANNETFGVSSGAPLKAIGGTEERWGGPTYAKGSLLEVVAVTLVLGIVSFWFGVKRLRESRMRQVESSRSETVPQRSPLVELLPTAKNTNPITSLNPPSTLAPAETPITDPTSPISPAVDIAKATPPANGDGNDNISGEYAGGDDSDREGEADGDVPNTPGKRKYRRGKRGKKKKVGIVLPPGVEEGEEDKISANGNDANSNGKGPESPALSSLVINSPKPPPVMPSLVVSDTILGFGSHGTVVFQGSLQGRAVAVKRLLQDFVTLASREVSILQESDDHPNVIRYYYQEAHANFLYIALELCPASLADIVESPDRDQWRDIAIAFDPKKALHQITCGLRHLHALKLVHRDIKPQNILVSGAKAGAGGRTRYRMLISDFGLCKKLDVDQTSFLPTAHGAMAAGTVGWRAPEILRGEVKLDDVNDDNSMSSRGSTGTATGATTPSTGKPTRLTKSVDIFALGCVFYYTLTNGSHPFGDRFEREVNILKNAKNLEGLERFGEEGAEAADLISSMLDPQAYERPDTTTCLLHPFFWDPGRRLNFLQDASDRFEIMCRDPRDPNLLVLEKDASGIVGNDWHSRLDKIFIENLGKFRKYDGRSVQDLLRALRNKKHHYQDMPENVKRHLGPMPEGFLSYFTRRFPKLFLHVHSVIGSTGLRSESMFRSYFELAE